MRLMPTVSAAVLAAIAIGSTGSIALAQSCDDLWVERNSYYKAAGYCFKTRRAIQYFGNGGCQYDNERDLPLSANVRARINQIVRTERADGCRG
jgi:hypothetical protein